MKQAVKMLQKALTKRKMPQAECARRMGVDRSRLHRIYHGTAMPTTREAVRLQQLFDISINKWLAEIKT